jgi:glycosyltransferase involved in cell wall biosynthesis
MKTSLPSLTPTVQTRPLHIGLVHGWFPPLPSYGGIVRYIMALAKGYTALGQRVTVITRDDRHPRIDQWEGITVHRVAVKPQPWLNHRLGQVLTEPFRVSAAYATRIQQIHQTDPLDLVEFTNYSAEGLAHSFKKVVPQVTRVSTMGWQSQQINALTQGHSHILPGDRWRNWCEGTAIRQSDLLITPSEFHATVVQQRYQLTTKPIAIPHGLRIPDATLSRGETDPIQFLFVGKIDPRKGFQMLLKAFAIAHQQLGSRIRLTVVGTDSNLAPDGGSYKAFTLQSIPASVQAHIDFLGWVADDKLPALYATCDVFIAPSRYESFGLIYLEAMQFQKPVIGCVSGGVPEIVRHQETGILVNPDDATALATAIVQLASDRALRTRLGTAGFHRWQTEFTEQCMCEKSLEVYEQLLTHCLKRH